MSTFYEAVSLKLKPEQLQAICHVYDGKDVFVVEFVKSVCYEMLPFVFDHKERSSTSCSSANCSVQRIAVPFETAYSVMIFMLPDLHCKYTKYSVWIPLRNTQNFRAETQSAVLQIALTLQIQSGKCCALGEFLIKLWSMCITSTTPAVHA